MSDDAARRRQRALSIGALWAPTPWIAVIAVLGIVVGACFALAHSRPEWTIPATGLGYVALAAAFVAGFLAFQRWLHHIHDGEWRPAADAALTPKQRMYAALGSAVPDYIRGSLILLLSRWGFDLTDAFEWLKYPAGIAATALLVLGFWFYYRAVRRYIDGLKGRF